MNPNNLPLFPPKGTRNVTFRNPQSATVKDKIGRSSYNVVQQGDKLVYQDVSGRRLGYVNSQGKTLSHSGHILATNPRPDLILGQKR